MPRPYHQDANYFRLWRVGACCIVALQVLNYSKNDEWGVGMILHELLSSAQEGTPFDDMERPGTFSDAGWVMTRVCVCVCVCVHCVRVSGRVDRQNNCFGSLSNESN